MISKDKNDDAGGCLDKPKCTGEHSMAHALLLWRWLAAAPYGCSKQQCSCAT
jgi:hypothetical protein